MNKAERAMCLSTIDEINQYLGGNVTKASLVRTLREFKKDLQLSGGLFYWSKDTLMHFYFGSMYLNDEELKGDILNFVHAECDLEPGETEEELADDLYSQVKNYNPSVELIQNYNEARR